MLANVIYSLSEYLVHIYIYQPCHKGVIKRLLHFIAFCCPVKVSLPAQCCSVTVKLSCIMQVRFLCSQHDLVIF